MSKKIDNGGPAFPATQEQMSMSYEGMSMRDYFAAKALQALIAKLPLVDQKGEFGVKMTEEDKFEFQTQACVTAYAYADYMLQARDRQ